MIAVFGDARLPPRFWGKVRQDKTACWLWTASRNNCGYGEFRFDRKLQTSHRVAYAALVGPVPEGCELDHLCRNRGCVNPSHLEAVTHKENVLRGGSFSAENAVKQACPRGHPFTGDNLSPRRSGGRNCRKCIQEAGKRNYALTRDHRLALAKALHYKNRDKILAQQKARYAKRRAASKVKP